METFIKKLFVFGGVDSSHSLGTLIEWKRIKQNKVSITVSSSSHSLGTLIEWKHYYLIPVEVFSPGKFPLAGDIN